MLALLVKAPVLAGWLDHTLPENAKGTPWTVLFPLLGLILLGGSIWAILTTDVGAKRAFQLAVGAFLAYFGFHSTTWIMSETGLKLAPTGYWQTRIPSFLIGIICFSLVGVLLFVWHMNERATQRVEEED